MKKDKPISLCLISGFLGAGKTTLLKRLLTEYKDSSVGVLVNEFGEVSIDGILLQNPGIRMVEISGGSIFCACLKGDFIQALRDLSEQPIDILFVENSGMSDPSSINRILKHIGSPEGRSYEYCGSVCLVDCTSFLKYAEAYSPLKRQVKASGLIVLNKTDLSSREEVKEVWQAVSAINPDAFIVEAIKANGPFEILNEKLGNLDYDGQSVNTLENRPESVMIFDGDRIFSVKDIESFCVALLETALRIKGFFTASDGTYHVDVASGNIRIERAQPPIEAFAKNTRIVVITPAGVDERTVLTAWSSATD